MSKLTTINATNFKSQLKTIHKDTIEAKASDIIPLAMDYVAQQANEHSNFAPFTHMINVIGQLSKPKAFKMLNRKTLIAHATECGLEINKDTKALRRVNKSNMAVNPTYWQELEVPADKTAAEKFEQAVKSAESNGLTLDQMLTIVGAQFEIELIVPAVDEAIAA